MSAKRKGKATFNHLLRRARQEHEWSQQDVANRIGASHAFLVSRWERGEAFPRPHYRQKLSDLFGKKPKELGLLQQECVEVFTDPFSPIHNSPFSVPPFPSLHLIGRDQLFSRIKQILCENRGALPIALKGLPGVGKTTLALSLVHDAAIQKHFCDGILWSGLGPKPDVPGLLNRWGKFLGLRAIETAEQNTYEAWIRALRAAIGMRRMLIVVDDAWTLETVLPFMVGGPNCSYVLTTRFSKIAISFAGKHAMHVQELGRDDGVALLQHMAPLVINKEEAQRIVATVGGLPLALTLIGNELVLQARRHQPHRLSTTLTRLHQLEERLRLQQHRDCAELHPGLPKETPLSLHAIIEMSDKMLDNSSRQVLQALSNFPPKPHSFSEATALAVAATTTETLDTLIDAGLIECDGTGRYMLHPTIVDYVRHKDMTLARGSTQRASKNPS